VTGPAAGAALTITANATDRGGQWSTSAVLDNDGIERAIDRGRTTGADQSGVYSSEFNDGTTAGVIQRFASAKVTAVRNGGAVRVTLVSAGTAQIQACTGNVKYVVLDAVGESADISCAATGTVTVTGRGPGTIELYKQTPGSVMQAYLRCESFSMFLPLGIRRALGAQCSASPSPVSYYYAYRISLKDGETASTGSPVTASPDNTEPIHVLLVQIEEDTGNQVEVGSFDLDPGESADVSVTPGANREDLILFSVLNGSVTVTIGDVTQTVSAGQQVTVGADLMQPTVAITSPSALTTSDSPIMVSVVFSEPVAGFDATRLVLTNATVSGFAGSGAVYTFALIPNAPGAVTAAIPGALFTDLAGNVNVPSAVFTRTFTWRPPVVTTSGDVTVEATSPNGAVATFNSSAVDAGGGSTDVTCVPQSGSTFPLGTTTVACSSTDRYNNTGSRSFSVKVVDTTKPTLTLPANITTSATSFAGAAVAFTASALDLVDGVRPIVCSPASGSTFAIGATTVSCTSVDTRGNSAARTFTVTVTFNFAQARTLLLTLISAVRTGNTAAACSQLAGVIPVIQAQVGSRLTQAEATVLIRLATDARRSLGCP
jgi:mannose-6-phosphate isomerase-like protein (cupin superfamily)